MGLLGSKNLRNRILRCRLGSRKGSKSKVKLFAFQYLRKGFCLKMTAIILENEDIDRMENLKGKRRGMYRGVGLGT